MLHFEIDGTPISLARTAEFHGKSEDSESLTGIKLASSEDVVTKKLYNRLYENGLTTERDAIRHPENIGEMSKRVTEPKFPHILRNLWIDLAEMFESDLAQHSSTEEGLGCE